MCFVASPTAQDIAEEKSTVAYISGLLAQPGLADEFRAMLEHQLQLHAKVIPRPPGRCELVRMCMCVCVFVRQ